MKKILAIILAVAMCLSLGTAAFAAEDVLLIAPAPAKDVNVNVTISDAGNLVLVQAPVSVTDLDEDGIVSINDALMAAHLAYYPGEAGYVYYVGDYGIAMDTLWGVTNGGSYMYYVNDLMPMSLGEEVKEGDSIVAYGFADLEYWGDTYTFFDVKNAEVAVGGTLELTLSAPDWSGNVLPVVGAEIVVDGAAVGVVTDENGKAAVAFDEAGEYLVSAKSETAVLVPPVCKVTVGDAEAAGEASRTFVVDMLYNTIPDTLVPGDYDTGFTDADSPENVRTVFRWAAYYGIIEGYGNGEAAPLNKVTRQELATILWRYAKMMGIDVSVGENTNILSYNDAADIGEWAIPAMQWACGAGILNDTDGNIRPAGEVTRGEVAAAVAVVEVYRG